MPHTALHIKKRTILCAVLYLDVFVVFPEVHQTMVSLDRFSKVSNVSANNHVVLPDLPVFIVTLQSFLQGMMGFVSAGENKKQKGKRKTQKAVLLLDVLSSLTRILIPALYCSVYCVYVAKQRQISTLKGNFDSVFCFVFYLVLYCINLCLQIEIPILRVTF